VPHWEQNLAASPFSVPQAWQCMGRCYADRAVSEKTLHIRGRKRYLTAVDVGIRELRAHLSRYVERVKDGEEIVVTEHGRPVARLVPLNGERKIDRLIREGVLIPARRPKGPRPKPLHIPGVSLSEIVREQRD
jgi:prevent-host-death family protein